MKVETMAVGTFRDNPNYVEIVGLLIDLHVLMRDGKGEMQAAEDIRDKMDAPWWELNEAERNRIDGMSADLYTLETDSPITHVAQSNIYSAELSAAIDRARRIHDYEKILQLLRERSHEISADRAAVLRGMCYEKLGDVDTAILFFEHSARLRETDDLHAAYLLTKLEQLEKTDRSLFWAREFLRRFDDPSPQLLLTSASALLQSIDQDRFEDRALVEESEQLVTAAVRKMNECDLEPPLKVLAVNRLVELAVRYEQIGEREKTATLLDSALEVDPNDDLALTVRGLLNYAVNTEAAIKDFDRAIKSRTSIIWPYFYSAHFWITNGEFQRALQFCDSALSLVMNDEVAAALWIWKAICSFELRGPRPTAKIETTTRMKTVHTTSSKYISRTLFEDESVRTYVDKALELSPWNDTIRFNAERFEAITLRHEQPSDTWSLESEFEPVDAARLVVEQHGSRIPTSVAAG